MKRVTRNVLKKMHLSHSIAKILQKYYVLQVNFNFQKAFKMFICIYIKRVSGKISHQSLLLKQYYMNKIKSLVILLFFCFQSL